MKTNPPEDLEALRRLYVQIRKGEHSVRLTERNLAILERMLDEPAETATKSISEVARENGINISTITRLAQKLGFEGFPGLKDLFRKNLKKRKSYYSGQVQRFLRNDGDPANETLLDRLIQDEWENVMQMAGAFDRKRFDTIVDMIVNAGRIHILGLRSSYPLAHYLGFYLKMICNGVRLIGQAGHTLAEDLAILDKEDVLVAISMKPYTRDTVDACRVCKQLGIDVIAITDSISSPLSGETDHFLLAAVEGDYFFSPIVTAVIYIETLLSGVVKKLGQKSIDRLNHAETVLDHLKTEVYTAHPNTANGKPLSGN